MLHVVAVEAVEPDPGASEGNDRCSSPPDVGGRRASEARERGGAPGERGGGGGGGGKRGRWGKCVRNRIWWGAWFIRPTPGYTPHPACGRCGGGTLPQPMLVGRWAWWPLAARCPSRSSGSAAAARGLSSASGGPVGQVAAGGAITARARWPHPS